MDHSQWFHDVFMSQKHFLRTLGLIKTSWNTGNDPYESILKFEKIEKIMIFAVDFPSIFIEFPLIFMKNHRFSAHSQI